MAKAAAQIFRHRDDIVETWRTSAGATVEKDTLVIQSGVPGIALTSTTGVSAPAVTIGPFTLSGQTREGASNWKADRGSGASLERAFGVALDGTWEFTGVVSTGTTPAPITTGQSTPVYVTSAGALTLESTGNTKVGRVNYPATYKRAAGKLPVKIGA
jgi:hypothetical protein